MDTVSEPQPKTEPELNLLTSWSFEGEAVRRGEAAIGSIAVHAAAILLMIFVPAGIFESHKPLLVSQQITPLVTPHFKLSIPNPGQGKATKTISMENLLPRPRIPLPPSRPSTTRPAAQTPAKPFVAPQAPAPAPQPKMLEPPKIETAMNADALGKGPIGAQQALPPPPQIQAEEKPKLAFETPGAPSSSPKGLGKLNLPSASVSEAIREMSHGGSGGLTVGDSGSGPGGLGPGINMPPSANKLSTSAKILSDEQGVDFAPYMLKVLAAVKKNWFAIYPESARLGTRGRVALVLAIDRSGAIPKLYISMPSGVQALDRAAVAGVSASQPLPPLPSEFRGNQILLQLVFAYNVPVN